MLRFQRVLQVSYSWLLYHLHRATTLLGGSSRLNDAICCARDTILLNLLSSGPHLLKVRPKGAWSAVGGTTKAPTLDADRLLLIVCRWRW